MDVSEWIESMKSKIANDEVVTFTVKIKPRGFSNTIKDVLLDNKTIKVSVSAPPLENRANYALIDLLSKTLNVPKKSIRIVRGMKTNFKLVRIDTTA